MSNILSFPDRGILSRPSAKQFADEMLRLLSDHARTDTVNRFELANMLMLLELHVLDRGAFSVEEIYNAVIDDRTDVHEHAESLMTD